MKISRTNSYSIFPKPLLDTDVPTEIFFRFESEIIPEDLVLTAGRTEPGCHTRVQRRVRPIDLIATSEAIRPHIAELIEVIEAPASDENQRVDLRGRLQKSCCLLRVIAHKGWLRSENLQNKWTLLPGIDTAVEES